MALAAVGVLAISGVTTAAIVGGDASASSGTVTAGAGVRSLQDSDNRDIRLEFKNDHEDEDLEACLIVSFRQEEVVDDLEEDVDQTDPDDACTGLVDRGDEDDTELGDIRETEDATLAVFVKDDRGIPLKTFQTELPDEDDVEICVRASGDTDDGAPDLEEC